MGPLIGGALAAIAYDLMFAVNATPRKVKGFLSGDYDDDQFDRRGRRDEPTDNDVIAENSELKEPKV